MIGLMQISLFRGKFAVRKRILKEQSYFALSGGTLFDPYWSVTGKEIQERASRDAAKATGPQPKDAKSVQKSGSLAEAARKQFGVKQTFPEPTSFLADAAVMSGISEVRHLQHIFIVH